MNNITKKVLNAVLGVGVVLGLAGCATLPDDVYVKTFTKTESGCYVAYMPETYSKVTWTGACEKGLATGKGSLVLFKKDNPALMHERYDGMMNRGTKDGDGIQMYSNVIRIGNFVDSYHQSNNRGKFFGRLYIDRKLIRDGEFDSNQDFVKGKQILTLGYVIDGIFDASAKKIDYSTGEGIISGRLYPKAEFTPSCTPSTDPKLTAIQKQELDDQCLFSQTLIAKPPIGGYFNGKVYDNMAALDKAESDYAAAKSERERIQAAQAAERARIEAIAAAERARVQAIADAERNRLQQIENAKQARYDQLRQPCTNARNEVASITNPELQRLMSEGFGLSAALLVAAVNKNYRNQYSDLQRKVEANKNAISRQENILRQTKASASSRADSICQRAEQAVNNQRNQDNQAAENERQAAERDRKVAEYKRASVERDRTKTDDPKVFGGRARGG